MNTATYSGCNTAYNANRYEQRSTQVIGWLCSSVYINHSS